MIDPRGLHNPFRCPNCLAVLVLGVLAAVVLACTPRQPTIREALQDLSRMEYLRDPKTKLCFAVIRFATYPFYEGVSITYVPSEACDQ